MCTRIKTKEKLSVRYTSMSSEGKLKDARFEIVRSQCSHTTQKSIVGVARMEFHFARGRPDYFSLAVFCILAC